MHMGTLFCQKLPLKVGMGFDRFKAQLHLSTPLYYELCITLHFISH